MPRPYPKEFRDNDVTIVRDRQPGQTIKETTAAFGIAQSCLRNWMRAADVELREARKRIRLLEKENEVLRRVATYVPQANLQRAELPARP